MPEQGGLPIEVQELRQVCIAVHDVAKSIERYMNILGIGQWSIRAKIATNVPLTQRCLGDTKVHNVASQGKRLVFGKDYQPLS